MGIGIASASRFGKSWIRALAESSTGVATTLHMTLSIERKTKRSMVTWFDVVEIAWS